MPKRNGFTLIELIVVIAVIAVLCSFVIVKLLGQEDEARLSNAKSDLTALARASEAYAIDYGYPPDVNRNIPPGMSSYLKSGAWPLATWPNSVYDWDNWVDPSTGAPIYQVSLRFCAYGAPYDPANFPKAKWAHDFDCNSGIYYCISGPCRAHIDRPITHPGLCINCH
jgi:prepilin-type N-terminal cleavage/methylation domain-containing protein